MGLAHRLAALLPALAGGLLVLFALIAVIGSAVRDPRPHDLPVGLAGPAPALDQLSKRFDSAAPGAFEFRAYASQSDALSALDSRTVDAVLVLGPGGPRLIVAGAAGDAVSGAVAGAFTSAFKSQGVDLRMETVHPFAAGDAHGLILFFVVLAVLVSTLLPQVLLGGAEAGGALRLAAVLLYAPLAALVAMGSANWITGGAYGSGFWTATGLVALASAAVGAVVAGSARLLGAAGLGLAALVVLLVDLVSSGGPAGSLLLPDFYRRLEPWMPAGQLYTALTSTFYFPDAELSRPVLVLLGWLAGGVLLLLLAELVRGLVSSRAGLAPGH